MSNYLYSLLAFDNNLQIRNQQIKTFCKNGFNFCHFDVMDGIYVTNTAFNTFDLDLLFANQVRIHVHLMVIDPINYIRKYIKYPINGLSFHFESQDIETNLASLQLLKKHNIKAGLAIHPFVDINNYLTLLREADYVTLMSVIPGKGGQTFLKETDDKLAKLISLRSRYNLNFAIEIDGGVNLEIIARYKNKINYYVSGSFLVQNIHQLANIKKEFKELVK
ncbi:ribulose-phosphate 3-epimerase [Ureaplasma sp. ES3154-GEN]|uniref:ribulose-phosphate 3-epimerase n=1 Tax=Ureaplasma sp. ES3154-GEN TaxID=2984844 RepID=UPI0021E8E1AF|nr:ribulose-phosphate 3-epimerase [Ureaplasma sp. ES3154-GEN]MCV3743508.1 ribulose-phosphate 3-epimerase [Ureaplasma sp. ES3154-GEN]